VSLPATPPPHLSPVRDPGVEPRHHRVFGADAVEGPDGVHGLGKPGSGGAQVTHMHAYTRTHTRTRTRAHTHTHTHTVAPWSLVSTAATFCSSLCPRKFPRFPPATWWCFRSRAETSPSCTGRSTCTKSERESRMHYYPMRMIVHVHEFFSVAGCCTHQSQPSADGELSILTKGDNNNVDDRGLYNTEKRQLFISTKEVMGVGRWCDFSHLVSLN